MNSIKARALAKGIREIGGLGAKAFESFMQNSEDKQFKNALRSSLKEKLPEKDYYQYGLYKDGVAVWDDKRYDKLSKEEFSQYANNLVRFDMAAEELRKSVTPEKYGEFAKALFPSDMSALFGPVDVNKYMSGIESTIKNWNEKQADESIWKTVDKLKKDNPNMTQGMAAGELGRMYGGGKEWRGYIGGFPVGDEAAKAEKEKSEVENIQARTGKLKAETGDILGKKGESQQDPKLADKEQARREKIVEKIYKEQQANIYDDKIKAKTNIAMDIAREGKARDMAEAMQMAEKRLATADEEYSKWQTAGRGEGSATVANKNTAPQPNLNRPTDAQAEIPSAPPAGSGQVGGVVKKEKKVITINAEDIADAKAILKDPNASEDSKRGARIYLKKAEISE